MISELEEKKILEMCFFDGKEQEDYELFLMKDSAEEDRDICIDFGGIEVALDIVNRYIALKEALDHGLDCYEFQEYLTSLHVYREQSNRISWEKAAKQDTSWKCSKQ